MKLDTSYSTLPQMNTEASNQAKTLKKIAAAVDVGLQDVSSRSIADMMKSQVSSMSQGLMNANDGISMMQIADGTLTSLSDQTVTLNNLSIRYNNDALSTADKQALQDQFNSTVSAMQQSISSSSFNGKSLFGSTSTFSLGDSTITASIPSLSPSSLSIDNQNGIQAYSDSLGQAGSNIGATTNGLISASNNLLNQISATSAAKSQLSDTDFATSISSFQQNTNQINAATIALAHQNDILRQSIGSLLGN